VAEAANGRAAYFETPDLAERLQLVAHLLRNAQLVAYLRGPAGAGKTCFAQRLASVFRQEAMVVELRASPELEVHQELAARFSGGGSDGLAAALDAARHGDLLLVVDDADQLPEQALAELQRLHHEGARMLLLGSADLPPLVDGWSLQAIDLPPFSEQQTREFLVSLGIDEPLLPAPKVLARLHRATGGWPGVIIDHLAGGGRVAGPVAGRRPFPWQWVLGTVAMVMVVLALWQQDAINALFLPPETPPPEDSVESVDHAATKSSPVVDQPPAIEQEDGQLIPLPPRRPAGERVAPPPVAEPPAVPVPLAPPAKDLVAPDTRQADTPVLTQPSDSPPPPPQDPAPAPRGVPVALPEPVAAPAPAASTQDPASAAAEAVPPEPLVAALPTTAEREAAKPEPVTAPSPPVDDLAWLRSRSPARYTLQLVGARDRGALDRFVDRYRLAGKYAVFTRDLAGKPWYSLVYGDYADRDAAIRARAKLPPALRTDQVWPRSFASIQEQLPTEGP
jgi:DamX protein